MGLAHLSIGTAVQSERINLLDPYGWHAGDWRPQAGDVQTTFKESALADYRQPASYKELTTIETIPLTLKKKSQDQNIRGTQDLRRTGSRLALNYWVTKWQNDIVYLEARASCESNTRYAWVYEAKVPQDANPYRQPFMSRARRVVMPDEVLIVERGPWLSNAPGIGTTVLAQGAEYWCFPSHLEFDGINDQVDCASDAKLDNLPDFAVAGKGPVTIEAWVRPTSWGGGTMRIVDKQRLALSLSVTNGLAAIVQCGGQQAWSTSGLDEYVIDGDWHYVLMTYSEVAVGAMPARTIFLNVDGVWVTTYPIQQVSAGNYLTDAGVILHIGCDFTLANFFDGDIGWVRVSNFVRYNPGAAVAPFTDFTPPIRCVMPDIDVNTMGQWIKEGQDIAGSMLNQAGGTSATITGATWDCDCPELFGYIPPPGGVPTLGWWDPADEGLCVWGAWQAKNAANFAGSLVDLTGNGHDLVDPGGVNTPGWDVANGWTFDGINDYLQTTFIPQNDQSQSMLCQFTNFVDIAGNNYLAGTYTAGNSYFTIAPDNGNIVFTGNGLQRWHFGVSFNNGNLGVAGAVGYKNGAPLANPITGYTVVPTFPLFVGCLNNAGAGAAGFAQVRIQSHVIYECTITAAQMNRVWVAQSGL